MGVTCLCSMVTGASPAKPRRLVTSTVDRLEASSVAWCVWLLHAARASSQHAGLNVVRAQGSKSSCPVEVPHLYDLVLEVMRSHVTVFYWLQMNCRPTQVQGEGNSTIQ